MTNHDRIRQGFEMLAYYCLTAKCSNEPRLECLTDILADLMHAHNDIFDVALRQARQHYEEEVER